MTESTEILQLRDYATKHWPAKGAKGAHRAKEATAEFFGVNASSVQRWLATGKLPEGLPLIRLWLFLEAAGYRIELLEKLKKSALYHLAEIVAFGIKLVSEMTEELGFTQEQSVLRLAHGGSATTLAREVIIDKCYQTHESRIQEERVKLLKLVGKKEDTSKVQPPVPTVRLQPEQKVSVSEHANMLQTLAYLILAARSIATRVASSEFSAEERRRLRELVGMNGVFDLSNALNKLCGETARSQMSVRGGSDE